MLAAKGVVRDWCLAPVAAEAMALLQAIRLYKEIGFLRVHFEGDAKSVIDSIHSDGVDSSEVGHLIEDIKWELRDFHQWKLTFVKKGGKLGSSLICPVCCETDSGF
jgi:hypothetical protein